MPTRKLPNQGFLVVKSKSSLQIFYGRHQHLVDCYGISVRYDHAYCFGCLNHNPLLSSFMTFQQVCNKSNTTDATGGAGTTYPSGVHEFISGFSGVLQFSVQCFVDCCLSCGFFLWPFVLSVILRFTAPDYLFAIFKLFFCFLRTHIHSRPLPQDWNR